MNKITLFITITLQLFYGIAYSQARVINEEYAQQMETIFEHLDKGKIPHGLLLDQSLDLIDLSYFEGNQLTDTNLVDVDALRDIYYTLLSSQVNQSQVLVSPEEISDRWTSARERSTITLTGICIDYAKFDENALNDGLIDTSNGKFRDVYVDNNPNLY